MAAVIENPKNSGMEQYENKQIQQLERQLKKVSDTVLTHTPRRGVDAVLEIINNNRIKSVEANKTICNWFSELSGMWRIEWDVESFNKLAAWLESLMQIDKVQSSALSAITALVKEQPQQCNLALQMFHPMRCSILQDLKESVDNGTLNEDKLFATLHCLDVIAIGINTTTETSTKQIEVLKEVGELVLHLHFAKQPLFEDSNKFTMFLMSTLALIVKISALSPQFAQEHASELFGLSRSFLVVGLDESQAPTLPQKMLPSHYAAYTDEEDDAVVENSRAQSQRSNGGKVSKSRKPRVGRNKPMEVQKVIVGIGSCGVFDVKTSDSDASEPESAGNRCGISSQERHRNTRIRLLCINLLGVTASALDRRTLYGYWNALFSGSGIDHMEPPSFLLNVSRKDPALRCRSAALQIISQLLYMLRGLLKQAESPKANRKSTAFLTFSQNLALIIVAIYKTITALLITESSLLVLTQALKCLAVLVQATPFEKLDAGIITCFMPYVRTLVYHRDYTIQLSALTVMEFLVAKPEFIPEIASVIGVSFKTPLITNQQHQNDNVEIESHESVSEYCESDEGEEGGNCMNESMSILPNDNVDAKERETNSSSWLLLRVLQNVKSDSDNCRFANTLPSSVRIESLQILATMAKHITLLLPHLSLISKALHVALLDSSSDVRIYAARCLDTIAYEIGCYFQTNSSRSLVDLETGTAFWQLILPDIIAHVSGSNDMVVAQKVSLCDALSNIGVVVYERLPRGMQLQLLSFLSGVSRSGNGGSGANDEDVAVSAAAVRAMAVFAQFPSLRQDLVFLEHTAESILRLMSDSNILVRIKAVWALGNITDALISNESEERFSNEMLRRLINAALKSCSDNDKVRCNAVRALGNLLRLILLDLKDNEENCNLFKTAVIKLSDSIRTTTGGAKVKWNSCYAIGNLLRYDAFYHNTSIDKTLQKPLYDALCHVVVHHANFKVRINAAAAISNIKRREYFGSYFDMFWSALLAGIEQSVQLEHFNEYNHRDKLQEQLCLTICHLIDCAQDDDLSSMKKQLTPRVEVVHNTWVRVVNRLVPEQAAGLLACSVKLQERFKNQKRLSVEQKTAITFIADALKCQ